MSQKRHTAEQSINWDSPCESSDGTAFFVKVNIAQILLRRPNFFPCTVRSTACRWSCGLRIKT